MLSPLSLHARQLDSVSSKFMCLPWLGTVDYVIYAMRWDWSPVRTIFIKTLHFHNQPTGRSYTTVSSDSEIIFQLIRVTRNCNVELQVIGYQQRRLWWCDVVMWWCGDVVMWWFGVMWCGVVRCGAVYYGVVWPMVRLVRVVAGQTLMMVIRSSGSENISNWTFLTYQGEILWSSQPKQQSSASCRIISLW